MSADIIRYSIPLFFTLMGLEIYLSRKRGLGYYRFPDTFSNLSCGVLQQTAGLAIKIWFIFLFDWVYKNWSLQAVFGWPEWPRTWIYWIVAFLAVDFFYYWFHRLSHGVNFLWAAHVVHHQSEEYNMAVALRQGAIQNIFNFIFFVPLAVLGFSTETIAICYSVNLIYQFWIHTRMVKTTGWAELILNTPAHHRVHHGVNPEYIDKNHAGVFIIWDRLFGSFAPERAEVVYGITTPLNTFNPLWAHVQPFVALARQARAMPSWRDKLFVWIARPGWRPESMGGTERPKPVSAATQKKFDVSVSSKRYFYVLSQFLILVGLSLALEPTLRSGRLALATAGAALVIAGLGSLGGVI
ncbi:MAG TPA: sterol desaturase family protein, partial [Bdellovibrionales bacterium]|nr:sterol desaturase family protein [Bdellovibrionales bacterium]